MVSRYHLPPRFLVYYYVKNALPILLLLLAAHAGAQEHFTAPPPSQGRFLLLDRDDASSLLSGGEDEDKSGEAAEEEGPGLDSLLDRLPISDYSQDRWNKVRGDIETGRFQREEPAPLARVAVSTAVPESPQPELEFTESGTSLSLTGRKVIGFNYTGKRYMNEQTNVTRPRSLSLFEISQQLQVRMQGKVGTKITVNVDYDDTKEDRQDISVVYQGDPNEVVQNVSFGDIDLSLPATEFVSYNKQLFGIRADLRAKGFALTFIGSRTKGQTKVRQYTGNTRFQTVDLQDVNYLRRRYYDITFGNTARLPIRPGSELVYLDTQSNLPVDNLVISSITADDLAQQTTTYTGRFQRLSPGIDYTVDYAKGILTFSRGMNVQDVVIIDYTNANGTLLSQNASTTTLNTLGSGRLKLVKTLNDAPISTAPVQADFDAQVGWNREIKTYYSIGQTNLVRDDGRGSFTLKLQDFNRNEVAAPNTAGQTVKYPDNIEVDFEQGIFRLTSPFQDPDPGYAGTPDRQIYSAAPAARRLFRVEYSYRFKTFLLEPSIVVNSEIVTVDRQKLRKNEEYFIDYDSGFITFYYPDRIGQTSSIEISYEVSPFGGAGNLSLVGGRVSYDFGALSLGSSLLYQGGVKSAAVPSVTDLTSSMFVYEGDAQFRNLNVFGMKMNVGGEIAQSRLNPNLNDFALVDNMEGVKQEDSPAMDRNYWQIAANPAAGPADPTSVAWETVNVKSKDINPASTSDGSQQVLSINYDFTRSTEVSIVYPLSATGLDFTQKTAIELVLLGQGAGGPQINLHFGQINEDADGRGGQNFACANGVALLNAPKSEDLNCDGQLSTAEDIGWLYDPVGQPNEIRYGANNGRIDTADLNRNGRLDQQDFSGGSFGYASGTKFTDTTDSIAKDHVDFSGWRTWNRPLFIASSDTFKWNAIKQIRVTLKKGAGAGALNSGAIRFARIAAVGNTWTVQQSATAGTLQLLGVNNIDNPGYIPIYNAGGAAAQVYNDLYGSVSEQRERTNTANVSEQALSVTYDSIVSTSAVYAFRKYPQPLDISQHGEFRFLLFSSVTANASFYLKIGDENNYFKASVAPSALTGWRLITLRQEDVNGDRIPDVWTNAGPYAVEISSRGNPSLQQVSGILIGVETSGGQQSGTFYLNEIHLAKPLTRTGEAKKVEASFEIPGWMSFGGKHRETDRSFQTPVSVISNQDNEQQTAYLNFNRLPFFPLTFTGSRQVTVTPNTYVTGGSNLVTSLQQGRVKKLDGAAAGNLSLGALPKLSLNYAGSRTEYDLLLRDDSRDAYSGALAYNPPFQFFLLPRSLSLTYSLTSNRVDYRRDDLLAAGAALAGLHRTSERVDAYGARLTFVPWRGSTFNPSYSLQETRERKDELFSGNSYDYPKARQQTADFNSNFMLARWFNPAVNYSVTTMENNNIVVTTVTVVAASAVYAPGEIKTVNRTAQGGVSLNFSVNDLAPRNRLLRSLVVSSNFQIQDGDTWQNVERDYDTADKLWVRDRLGPRNSLAQRTSLTTRDTFTSNQRWQPLEGYTLKGRLSPLSTISITNNFSNSDQRSDVTGTQSRSVNRTFPDAILSLSQLEVLAGAQSWARGATMNVKYSNNTNETRLISLDLTRSYGMDLRFRLLEKVDAALSYNHRFTQRKDLRLDQITQQTERHDATVQGTFDYRKFRFTPKLDFSVDHGKTGLGVVNQDLTVITPSLLLKTDFQAPKGLRLPFMKQAMVFSNRIVWTTTLSYALRKSPITVSENTRLFSLNSSADYEAAKNLRLTFNASVQRLWHKYLKQEDYLSYMAGSTLTFQF
ncbi:MAG: hypothetical protein FD189_630 [Elusimicrobia bacterium]|nr:MAG: hypothetical protein FD154_628 [Elusimicrobiota bacterium]KAF0157362.1 MAG: hypothetical protein FD189_630 [Elusimicrobiota bacterium]